MQYTNNEKIEQTINKYRNNFLNSIIPDIASTLGNSITNGTDLPIRMLSILNIDLHFSKMKNNTILSNTYFNNHKTISVNHDDFPMINKVFKYKLTTLDSENKTTLKFRFLYFDENELDQINKLIQNIDFLNFASMLYIIEFNKLCDKNNLFFQSNQELTDKKKETYRTKNLDHFFNDEDFDKIPLNIHGLKEVELPTIQSLLQDFNLKEIKQKETVIDFETTNLQETLLFSFLVDNIKTINDAKFVVKTMEDNFDNTVLIGSLMYRVYIYWMEYLREHIEPNEGIAFLFHHVLELQDFSAPKEIIDMKTSFSRDFQDSLYSSVATYIRI